MKPEDGDGSDGPENRNSHYASDYDMDSWDELNAEPYEFKKAEAKGTPKKRKMHDDTVELIDDMADIRYEISSDEFVIEPDNKMFRIDKAQLAKLIKDEWPWPQASSEKGAANLGDKYPKISMRSTETKQLATFFLAEITILYMYFKPSKGTVMPKNKPQLKGWVIEVSK